MNIFILIYTTILFPLLFYLLKQVTSFGVGMKAEKFLVHNILSFIVYSTINVAY